MASCQDDDDHCPMMALDELNKTVSRQMVLGTFSDLIQLYDKNNYSCHHEGHHLGMWLYDYTRNLKEALNYATLLCGGSVYHGIFQSYFGGEQFVHNVDKNQIIPDRVFVSESSTLLALVYLKILAKDINQF